ncbi:MAG: nucleotidyltransferase domain-containing protein [Candidatus Kryptonium sp.]
MNNESDIDFLLVVKDLPSGRVNRVMEFLNVERRLRNLLSEARRKGVYTDFSPVIKTPEEVEAGSLLFLDMLEDGKILFDRDDFLKRYFEKLRDKLKKLGARRVNRGEAWFWILKENYKPGEIFEIL